MRTRALTIFVCSTLVGCSTEDNIPIPWPDTDAKIYLGPETWVWTNSWEADRYPAFTRAGLRLWAATGVRSPWRAALR